MHVFLLVGLPSFPLRFLKTTELLLLLSSDHSALRRRWELCLFVFFFFLIEEIPNYRSFKYVKQENIRWCTLYQVAICGETKSYLELHGFTVISPPVSQGPCCRATVTGHFAPKSFRLGYLAAILERGLLYLKHTCFGLCLIERGILYLEHAKWLENNLFLLPLHSR